MRTMVQAERLRLQGSREVGVEEKEGEERGRGKRCLSADKSLTPRRQLSDGRC